MQYSIIPCVEGDDELIADKLNAITDSKIDFEDAMPGAILLSTAGELRISIFCGWKKSAAGRELAPP